MRPRRSATRPKTMPPTAQPTSSSDVRMPVHRSVAARRRGRAERDTEEHRHAGRRDEVEEQAVEDVEAPAKPRREQDHPLEPVHVEHGQAETQRGPIRRTSKAAPRYHQFLRKSFTPLNPW